MSTEKRKGGKRQTEYNLFKKNWDQLKTLWCWIDSGGRRMWIMGWEYFWGLNKAQMCYQVPDVQQCQSGWGKKTSLPPFRRDKPKAVIRLESCSLSKHHSVSLHCTTQCPQTKLQPPGTKHSWHSSEAVLRIQSTSHCAFLCDWWKFQSIIMSSFDFAVGQHEPRRVWWFLGSKSKWVQSGV